MEEKLAKVTDTPKQAKEIQGRWSWVEPEVWTTRMLTALEKGVKGGVWFSLIDKVTRQRTLERAFEAVKKRKGAPGIDGISIKSFEKGKERELGALKQELKAHSYKPRAVRRVYIPKLGSPEKRPLGIPTVRDRLVQTALKMVIEPIFERTFVENSYGFRPGRSAKDALRTVDKTLRSGKLYVVDADIKSYFDTISHEKLMEEVKRRIADTQVLALIKQFLNQGVLEEMREWKPTGGTPQGAVISPLLANIYLNPLDQIMEQKGMGIVRYADDFVILCRSREEAEMALRDVREWMATAQLTLHSEKTRIVNMTEKGAGFDFLGYHFERTRRRGVITRWPRKKSMSKLRNVLRARTRKTNGHSLPTIITAINPVLRGWFNYFKHSNKSTFKDVDGWVRTRLRSILRKRMKRKGRARRSDIWRWPTSFFAAQGLFSLTQALADARSVRASG